MRNTVRGSVNAVDIITAYRKAFNMSWWQVLLATLQGVFKLADQYYQVADEAIILEILERDKTDLVLYVAEDNDCDDRAFRLMGVYHQDNRTVAMPIFITWVSMPEGGHAVLSYYKNGKVHIIEPQNDEVYFVPKDWSLMLLCG